MPRSIAVPLAVGLGILSAINEGRLTDRIANVLTLIAISVPEFFVGYVLIILFAINFRGFLRWRPSFRGWDSVSASMSRRCRR